MVRAPNGVRPAGERGPTATWGHPSQPQCSTSLSWSLSRPSRVPLMAFLVSLLMFVPLVAPSPLVTLSSGTFRGLAVNGTDRWLGIPYAQPPLGPLRFEAPVPISRPAEGVQDALNFSYACPQPPTTAPISEDCLYLNVCRRSLTAFYVIISCMCRCGGHYKLVPPKSFLSLCGFMCEQFELRQILSANLLGGWGV